MSDISSQDSHLGRLAAHLTELVNRLRLSSSPDSGRLVLPTFLIRLETSSRLLAYAGTLDKDPGFQDLANVVSEFITFVGENPGRYPRELDGPLDLLADHLEKLLADIDAGESTGFAAADPCWADVLRRVESAGTVLAVMDDLEQTLDRWEAAYRETRTGPAEEEELHLSWVALRNRGDRLFEKPILNSPPRSDTFLTLRGRRTVCGLLLDSPFHKEQLLEKIRRSGGHAVVLACPEQVSKLAEEESGDLVLLGDNLEPTRNLERIIAALPNRAPAVATRCILVSGSRQGRDELRGRAEALGATGVWTPPFEEEELQRILARDLHE